MDNRQEKQGGGSLTRRIGLLILGYALAFLVYILGMTLGWGLSPRSWWWIVLGGFLGPAFVRLFTFAFGKDISGKQ